MFFACAKQEPKWQQLKLALHPLEPNRRFPAFGPEMPVRLLSLGRTTAGLALFGILAGHANAQAIGSPMGAQARATVRITVSVRPMFAISQSKEAVTVSSNASSSLRYAVVTPPASQLAAPVIEADGQRSPTTAVRSLASAQDSTNPRGANPSAIYLIVPD